MYLDPGFGSMLIQILLASIAAAASMFGIFRNKIMSLFRRTKNTKKDDTSEERPNGK